MPKSQNKSRSAPPVTFRPADSHEHDQLHREAAQLGITPSEYLRSLLGRGREAQRRDAALLATLRGSGATAWIRVRPRADGNGPDAVVAKVEPPDAGVFGTLAEVEAAPLEGERYALTLAGIRQLAGARVVLAVLPVDLTATMEVRLGDLGALRQVTP